MAPLFAGVVAEAAEPAAELEAVVLVPLISLARVWKAVKLLGPLATALMLNTMPV